MPVETTVGRLLLEDAVPAEARAAAGGVLDKKGISKLGAILAAMGPDVYRRAMKRLTDVAVRTGYESGGYSFGPEDMEPGPMTAAAKQALRDRVRTLLTTPGMDPKTRDAELVRAALEAQQTLQDVTLQEHRAAKNPLALQVDSGAKGKAENLRALVVGDVMYTDQNYKPIPYPILSSFAEGMRPHEYLASTFGARQSIGLTKLGTASGGYLCIGVGTSVAMADGSTKPIEAVRVGDVVVGADRAGHTFPTKVTGVFANGPKVCRKYVFRDLGSHESRVELVATQDHKVLARLAYFPSMTTRTGEPMFRDLAPTPLTRVSNYFEAQPPQGGVWGGVSEPRAAILGVMLGDGYLGREGRGSTSALQLSCADPQLIGDLLPDYEELGLQLKPTSGYAWMVTRPDKRAGRNPLAEWLRELGLFGTRSHTKFIPDVVWGWDDDSVAEFVGGLIATDGCVQASSDSKANGNVSFASVSERLIHTLRRLLSLRFGILTPPPICLPPTRNQQAVRDLYVLSIGEAESLKRFAAVIPVPGVKREKVAALVANMTAKPSRKYTQCYRPIVKECVDVGVVDTYDIEVDHPDHLFVLANGLIVSNSKRIGNLAHRLVVTADDGPEPHPDDAPIGLPVDTAHPDNEGAFLAHPAGDFPRNTHLTREVLAQLQRKGIDKIIVRSPAVGGPADGGVYGLDVGVRERNRIAPVGDFVGRSAADSISEPVTQTIIGCLVAGTEVRMADWGVKKIEHVAVGDVVLGADELGNTFPVTVSHVFNNGVRESVRTVFTSGKRSDEKVLESTRDHKVLAETRMASCAEAAFNDVPRQLPVGVSVEPYYAVLAAYHETSDFKVRARVDKPTRYRRDSQTDIGLRQTYDIEVDHPAHLFVLANGLIVSNSKHSGGVAGTTAGQQGFPVMERMFSAPNVYQGGVVHAQRDGHVSAVRPAPQGGHYVEVDGEEHYVHPDLTPTVKPGDDVEAGDPLSDGVKNPSELVRHKGIGEARRQFVDEFIRVAKASGFKADRRNMELIARGFMDHVHVDRELGEYAPGEVVPYTALAAEYEPRADHRRAAPAQAVGSYLERPALHYTIGTRVTPSVAKTLAAHGVQAVVTHHEPPPFTPTLIRSNDVMSHDRDWMTQSLGSGLYSSLLKSVARGAVSDPYGTSYVPALAEGVNFGAPGTKTRGWAPTPPAVG